MQRVEGVVQHYAWGDPAFIPNLLQLPPDGRPWAELWLGTHPTGPASLDDGTPLADVAGPLPYLLKVLAAAEPLSLQTHPDAAQAADGYARGIYPDANPKPELLCALSPFEAFCGVRPVAATLALLDELGTGQLRRAVATGGVVATLEGLFRGALDPRPVIDACVGSRRPEARWVRKLDEAYPGEPSVAATLLLNYVELRPGEALRFNAGNLHAYLHGAGIELMGASDNVVRGGLTAKAVDVDELLRVVDPEPLVDPVLPVARRYDLDVAGVALVRLDPGDRHVATGHEISIDELGNTWYCSPGDEMTTAHITYVVVPV